MTDPSTQPATEPEDRAEREEQDEPTPEGFAYADHTDTALLAALAARGITGEEARTAIAQARSWPGAHRDLVQTEVAAAHASEQADDHTDDQADDEETTT